MTNEEIRDEFSAILDLIPAKQAVSVIDGYNPEILGALMKAAMRARALVTQLAPDDGTFLPQLNTQLEKINNAKVDNELLNAVIAAAAEHFGNGWHRLHGLVLAEVFDDLIEMAEYLLGEGYHLPAAAIGGAVLEDTLRKVCDKHQVTWQGHSCINTLNTALYTSGVYDKAQHGQVDAWAKLRNKVDHRDFKDPADVDPKDVERMVGGVRDFIVKYLA